MKLSVARETDYFQIPHCILAATTDGNYVVDVETIFYSTVDAKIP
jgi:hypothetical protein